MKVFNFLRKKKPAEAPQVDSPAVAVAFEGSLPTAWPRAARA